MEDTKINKPYIIQTDCIEERYARGWHCLGKADEFTEAPTTLNYFGKRLAAYRGKESGKVIILDSYCPHMGADLSRGTVEGESLRCPFHNWRWGADGVCDDIPYADRIPAKAVIGSYETLERNGLLFLWHDPEGLPPIEEQLPRKSEDYYSGEWSDWHIAKFTIESNCRELVDNMADMAHFGPVHFSAVDTFRNIQDGHTYTQYMSGGHEILADEGQKFTSVATYEGPSYMTTAMEGSMDGHTMTTHLLVANVPITTEKFEIFLGVMLKKDPSLSEEANSAMVAEYTQMSVDSFVQDVEIWNTKIRVDNPLMCDGDGPINMLRKWYSQFYMNRADIPESLATAKKEHETKIKYKR
ncbi:MAG: Rieske 2Fe-2S domain-containing protein [Sinobacterium sp.]|nr:Rieske 2Fe-2S domain-containing protein [Sinobacterium sp.]